MIFRRNGEKFTTRYTLNNENLERTNQLKLLGLHITENLSWSENLFKNADDNYTEICFCIKRGPN